MMKTTAMNTPDAVESPPQGIVPEHHSSARFDQAREVLDRHQRDPHKLIAILQEIQKEYAYLPEDIMAYLSAALGISPSRVYGVATFYSHFTLEPKGKYIIKVCDGTACHVKKSEEILKVVEDNLGLSAKKKTTPDMLFTLETVACLGACALAPVLLINEEVHGSMNREKTVALLEKIKKEENGDGTHD